MMRNVGFYTLYSQVNKTRSTVASSFVYQVCGNKLAWLRTGQERALAPECEPLWWKRGKGESYALTYGQTFLLP